MHLSSFWAHFNDWHHMLADDDLENIRNDLRFWSLLEEFRD